MPFVALQGRPLQSATIGYAITPNPIRPKYSPKRSEFHRFNSYFCRVYRRILLFIFATLR